MVVFLSRFLCDCCSVLAVMFVTAVIASHGGKGKSYCCILTSLILILEVAVECDAGNVLYWHVCPLCLLAPVLDLLIQVRQREPPSTWDNTSSSSLRSQTQKTQKFGPKTASVLCDWTFTLHVPECFKKSSFLPYFSIKYKACIFSERGRKCVSHWSSLKAFLTLGWAVSSTPGACKESSSHLHMLANKSLFSYVL